MVHSGSAAHGPVTLRTRSVVSVALNAKSIETAVSTSAMLESVPNASLSAKVQHLVKVVAQSQIPS